MIDGSKTAPRLAELVAACPICETIADIGTDHGKTAMMLINAEKCRHVIATDISRASLEKAENLFRKTNRESFATFLTGDGLQPVLSIPQVGAAVISGIGGETISGFLIRDLPLSSIPELIISPQTDVPSVRRAVYSGGYHITRERIIESKRRFYHIINAAKGEEGPPDRDVLLFGNVKPYTDETVYEHYLAWVKKVLEKIPVDYRDRVSGNPITF